MQSELTGKVEKTLSDKPATQLVNDYKETKEEITGQSQSIEGQQRQKKIAEQFAANEEDTNQQGVTKRRHNIMRVFLPLEEELVDLIVLVTEEISQQQESSNHQFFDNQKNLHHSIQ